jgi:hypothetical protein
MSESEESGSESIASVADDVDEDQDDSQDEGEDYSSEEASEQSEESEEESPKPKRRTRRVAPGESKKETSPAAAKVESSPSESPATPVQLTLKDLIEMSKPKKMEPSSAQVPVIEAHPISPSETKKETTPAAVVKPRPAEPSETRYGRKASSPAELHTVGSEYWKATVLKTKDKELKPIARRKKLMEGILSCIENGFITFSGMEITFTGSHADFDNTTNTSRRHKSLGHLFKHAIGAPHVHDLDIEQTVRDSYSSLNSGMITKIKLRSFTNQSDKYTGVKSVNHDHLNCHSVVENEHAGRVLFVAPPNTTHVFDDPITLYDVHKCLRDNRQPRHLISGRTTLKQLMEQVRVEQKSSKSSKFSWVLIPRAFHPLDTHSENLAKTIIPNSLEVLETDTGENMYENSSLYAFILSKGGEMGYFGQGKDEINTRKAQKLTKSGNKNSKEIYIRIPTKIVASALLKFSAVQAETSVLAPINFNDILLRICPANTLEFCSKEGTEHYYSSGYESKYASNLEDKRQHENGKGRTISFNLEITVLPNLGEESPVTVIAVPVESAEAPVDPRENFMSAIKNQVSSAEASKQSEIMKELGNVKVMNAPQIM